MKWNTSCVVVLFVANTLSGQAFTNLRCPSEDESTSNKVWPFVHFNHVCDLRRTTLPLVNGQLSVVGTNGSIEVIGESRQDISLEARVTASASSYKEAEALEHAVQILTVGSIRAEGPETTSWFGSSWSVNYRLEVPHRIAATLRTHNGQISVKDLSGNITLSTTDGPLILDNLSGEVHANTVNGRVDVKLKGSYWDGALLFASTTNGSISVGAPTNYSAHLVADTGNGRISTGALLVRSQHDTAKRIETDMGRGGSLIQFRTVHGNIAIEER